MRAPGAPVGPAGPCAPMGPEGPSVPRGPAMTAPGAPVAPVGPCSPMGPVAPWGPGGPTQLDRVGSVVLQPTAITAIPANINNPRFIFFTSGYGELPGAAGPLPYHLPRLRHSLVENCFTWCASFLTVIPPGYRLGDCRRRSWWGARARATPRSGRHLSARTDPAMTGVGLHEPHELIHGPSLASRRDWPERPPMCGGTAAFLA